MITIDKPGLVCLFADSGLDAVNWIRATPNVWGGYSSGSQAPAGYGGRISTFGVDFEGACHLVETGWQEGVDKMLDGLRTLLATNTPGINRWRNDVAGEQPDIYRAIAGEPAAMRRKNFSVGSKPVIHIVINTAMKGSATDTQTSNYGVAVLALIDFLESRGRRVELDRLGVVYGMGRHVGRSMQGWKVKRAEESADLAAIAFAIAHPASHRRLVWGMRERGRGFRDYGSPATISREDAKLIGADNAFILDSVGNDGDKCNSPQAALRLAASRLNKAAGEELVDMAEIG